MNLGNVSITAPVNGTVHLVLTGYAYMYENNTARLGLGTAAYSFNLGYTQAGVYFAGDVTTTAEYSMTTQAMYNVTQGNTYTFYVTAWRNYYNDHPVMSLYHVYVTAVFLAT